MNKYENIINNMNICVIEGIKIIKKYKIKNVLYDNTLENDIVIRLIPPYTKYCCYIDYKKTQCIKLSPFKYNEKYYCWHHINDI